MAMIDRRTIRRRNYSHDARVVLQKVWAISGVLGAEADWEEKVFEQPDRLLERRAP